MAGSVFRGTVSRVTEDGVYVTIPDLGGEEFEFGPLKQNFGSFSFQPIDVADTATVDLELSMADPRILTANVKPDSIPLDDLSDVVISAPDVNHVLQYDGANWVNKGDIDITEGNTIDVGNSGSSASLTVKRTAGTDMAFSARQAGDVDNRIRIRADGQIIWGDGTSGVVDTNLYRLSANVLATDDSILLTDGTKQVNVGASGSGATFAALRSATTDPVVSGRVGADTNSRFFIRANGDIVWGDGTITDITLARAGNNTLLGTGANLIMERTSSSSAALQTRVTGDSVARLSITADGDIQYSDGTTENFRLERLDADDLQLNDARFRVRRDGTTDGAIGAYVTGDSQTRFNVNSSGTISWSDGTSSADTNLFRGGANELKTNDVFNAVLGLQINGVDLIDLVYPVGSIYMSMVNTSPASFIGGTWSALQDRWLVGAGGTYAVDSTGGATTHVHNIANTGSASVAHTHSMPQGNDLTGTPPGSGGTTFSLASHTHGGTGSATSTSHAHTNPDTDSGSSLPPFRAVYMWKRTA